MFEADKKAIKQTSSFQAKETQKRLWLNVFILLLWCPNIQILIVNWILLDIILNDVKHEFLLI